MNAVILAIGDELVLGQTVDTNSAWISSRLACHGIMTRSHTTVSDDVDAIESALRAATTAADMVIVTGGIGPTRDDMTRDALSRVIGAPLELHAPSMARIEAFFKQLGRPMASNNRVQAMIPRGVDVLVNEWGTAPGMSVRVGEAQVYVFPGVPREMAGMFDRYVVPRLAGQTGRVILTETIHTFGAGESTVGERLGNLMQRDRNPVVGTTVSGGIVSVRIRSDFPAAALAERALADTVRQVEEMLGALVFGRGETTMGQVVVDSMKRQNKHVATAESCTGGLVAKLFTDIAGSSAIFIGGWVVYSNQMKTGALGIPAALIDRHGAVSEEVAVAMAEQACRRSGADYALALTGIAGPDGGSTEKPVGTVWIALARMTAGVISVTAECGHYPGMRDMVRDRAAKSAMNMLRLDLQKTMP